MSEPMRLDTEVERKIAVDLFNLTWRYLDRPERGAAENDTMLHCAHASRFHWGNVGTPVNFARGEWQVSRVYAVLGRSEPALYHARRCLELCLSNGIGDFDLAFAYEALARSYGVAGDAVERDRFLKLAEEAGKAIAEADDKEILEKDLDTVRSARPAAR